MNNIGLKNYSKNLEVGLPLGKAYVNLCPNENNVILDIPIIESLGISFLFNRLKRNERGTMGKGGHISLFKKLDHERIYNPDFSVDDYYLNELNSETGFTLTKVPYPPSGQEPTYELKDKDNNTFKYINPNFNYPTEYTDEKNVKTTYSFENNLIRISSKTDTVEISFRQQDGFIERVEYIQDYTTISTVTFSYTNELLTAITFESPRGGSLSYEINHDLSSLEVKDPVTGISRVFLFEGQEGRLSDVFMCLPNSQVRTDFHLDFDVLAGVTTVTDSNNRKEYYFFEKRESNGRYFNSLFASEDGLITTNEFNDNFKLKYEAGYNRALVDGAELNEYAVEDFISTGYRDYTPTNLEQLIVGETALILETNRVPFGCNVNANGGDAFTLTCLVKPVNGPVEVSAQLNEEKTTIKLSNNWKLLCVKTNIREYTENLSMVIETTGEIVIGAINLFKKAFGSFYTYDNNGNVTGNGTYSITNSNGFISNIVNGNGFRYGFEYDNNKDLVRFKALNGVEVNNTYDGNHNLTHQSVEGRNITINSYTEYDNNGKITFERGDNPYGSTLYFYDEFGALSRIEKATSLVSERIYDEYGELHKLLTHPYNGGGTPDSEVEYVPDQDNPKLLKHIQINNGTIYTFEYDDWNRVIEIKLNGTKIFGYSYYDNNLIKQQFFGNDKDYFLFEYNNKGEVTKASYSTGDPYYEYDYDSYGRLEEIRECRDGEVTVLEHYSYNSQNELVKTHNSVKTISKIFDNNDKEIRSRSSFNGKEIIQEHDSVERSMGSNQEMIFDEVQQHDGYSVASFVGGNACVGGEQTYPCHYRKKKNNASSLESGSSYYQVYESGPEYDGDVPCVNSSSRIAYVVKGATQSYTQQTVAFWFKTTSHKNNACLFYTKSQYDSSSLALYERYIIGRYCLEVVITDSTGNSMTVLTTLSHDINPEETHFALNKWNFIALTCYVEYKNGQKMFSVELQLNALRFEKTFEQDFRWDLKGSNLEMNFGYIYNPQNTDNQLSNTYDNCKFALIAIGNRKKIATDILSEYYRKTEDYLADNTLVGETNISDCSITRLIKTGYSDFGTFKVFPLENNLFSLSYDPASRNSSDMPDKFDLRKGYSADKDTAFNFDENLKKYVFIADGNKLSYKAHLGGSGTVAASFYFDDVHEKQFIFDVKSDATRISLFKDGVDNQLGLTVESNGAKETKWISWWPIDHSWHNIALSFDRRIQTGYFGSTYSHYIRVMSDGRTVLEQEFTNISSVINDAEIMLGRSFTVDPNNSDSNSSGLKYSALFGRISNFVYNNAYNSEETMNELFEKLKNISKLTHYNEFGMPVKEEIIKNGNTIYSRTSEWSGALYYETISVGSNQETSRTYYYDKLNNLTGIETSDGQSFNYSYDYNGFLMHEGYTGPNKNYWMEYTYDSNGNILSRTNDIIHDTFVYVGDRLVRYNGQTVEYWPNNIGNIRSFNGWTFNYEGRRLVEATCMVTPAGQLPTGPNGTKPGKTQKLLVRFQYNDKGLRTSKTAQLYDKVVGGYRFVSQVFTTYEYDGNNLVYEKTGSRELFFLYDENKELYGYIMNGNKYFYMKDSFKNILGVTNENGTVITKYIYDAYGNLINSEGSLYNPIRYKGYYYDGETDMFYCKSRYYVPKLCRWLNVDNPSFLQDDNAMKLNLFAYCANNPVMNVDPEGHSWSSFWDGVGNWFKKHWVELAVGAGVIALGVVTMGVGAAVGGATAAAVLGVMGSTALQSIGTALVSAAISGVVGGIASAIDGGNFWDGFGDGVASGFMWGGIIAGASNILGGAMAITRAINPGFNGFKIGGFKLWSPNSATNKNVGGTLLKIGRAFRMDVEAKLGLHIHLAILPKAHIPIAWLIGAITGSIWSEKYA